ncbi:MAG: asparagine synthase (glutamine-hydrolyzing) [Verrucomicrobia bacterium]|nr:asparagine synthase (glutamine-hydrolyzing) [Verrucomicrobiota bacterium]
MCGIAGILHPAPQAESLRAVLPHVLGAIRHRGPDDEGTYYSADGCIGLTHCRLSILDLSEAGHQPMFACDDRYVMVYNGEIFNFRELTAEVRAAGLEPNSTSDTEIILLLHHLHGPAFLQRLRGMYALALWDQRERTCLLARDPLGIKPLYYALRPDGTLGFASEMRALLSTGVVPRRLDPEGLLGYFRRGSVPEPHTLIQGAKCLEAGTWMLWRDGRIEQRQTHWRLPFGHVGEPTQPLVSVTEDAAFVRAQLLDTVEHHFVSDVPVGLFLSGGIDSTALVALAKIQQRENLDTYSISFDEEEYNEGYAAARTARHFGTRHVDHRLTAAEARALFDRFLKHIDQPSIDGFNTYAISKIARDAGKKVVLSGLGGDEVFGSYPSFERIPKMLETAQKLGPLASIAGRLMEHWPGHPRVRRLGTFLREGPSVTSAMNAYRGIFTDREARRLTEYFLEGSPAPSPSTVPIRLPGEEATIRDTVSALEITQYMRNQLLRDSDVASMAWGLELRVPLVDSVLYEQLARVPPGRRLRPGKAMLLEALPEIPEWVARGAKRGFSFPFDRWLESDWRGALNIPNRLPDGIQLTTWYQKWCIFVFRRWWEM